MKNKLLFAMTFVMLYDLTIAQSPNEYRRSSLALILLESPELGKSRDLVVNAYSNNPFPVQFNKHNLVDSRFEVEKVVLTNQDYFSAGWYLDTLRTAGDFLKAMKKPLNALRYLNPENTIALQEPTEAQLLQIKLQKYIREKELAKQMVATWFNRDPITGTMDFNTLIE